ncbi:PilZ domain-containing protein [Croceicoccus bisphenolivorans]|uniref:PilZ domain-containing protein n=1 Tax=Croceicoccus bisphenolivorans TaxID=1783232 RepID=UPI000836CB73|nr:PilZ domain-containing protein [Croceicoccus bisphenolivorans]
MDSRQANRIEVSAPASFRRGPGLALTVAVADLTPQGCRLVDIPRTLSRGETISLRIAGVGPLLAHVRWLRLGREAGLEFDRPLSDAIYTLIAGHKRAKTTDPYRAEIMELHNDFVAEDPDAAPVEPEFIPPETAPDEPARAATRTTENRVSERFAAGNDPAVAIDPKRGPVEVRILDFSHHGLKIDHDGIPARTGSRLTLVFPDNQTVDGEVRWNNGTNLGIRVLEIAPEAPLRAETEPRPRAENRPPISVDAQAEIDDGGLAVAGPHDLGVPDIPDEHLARFVSLLEAARSLDFVTVTVRADPDGITMELSMKTST